MKSRKMIHFITNLKVRLQTTNSCNLLMMEVKGYSDNEQNGIARLEPTSNGNIISEDGYLELQFIIHPIKNSGFKRRNWDICPIFRFEEMPMKLKGVHIKAETNEEMILI
jgi:hypothetical protein